MICSRRPAESKHSDPSQFGKDDVHDMSWFHRHGDAFGAGKKNLLLCGAEAEQGVTATVRRRSWDVDTVGELGGKWTSPWRGEDDVSDPPPLDHVVPSCGDGTEEGSPQSPEVVLRHRC
jgi:hypothetical protein